jgi:hypothetical protein
VNVGAHKHGVFSFTVRIERMRSIGGDEFVAEVTSLRRHDATGIGRPLDVPNLPEQYGATASEAESHAVSQMRVWLSMAIPFIADHADRRLA